MDRETRAAFDEVRRELRQLGVNVSGEFVQLRATVQSLAAGVVALDTKIDAVDRKVEDIRAMVAKNTEDLTQLRGDVKDLRARP